MFYKGFGSKKQLEQNLAAPSPGIPETGRIELLLNASGRVNLQILEQMAATSSQPDFVRFMRYPVLAGSSIQAGELASRRHAQTNEINQTFVFQMAVSEDAEAMSDTLKQAIYPLIKERDSYRAPNIFTIGRVNGNDIIIPDIAISKRHAIIERKDSTYFIRDCNSTNATMINGGRIENKAQPIQDGDVISFARYEFTFLVPDSLYHRLIES